MTYLYTLYENGKKLKKSNYFEKLLNYTATNTTNAMIYCGEKLMWVQRPENYYK